MPPYSISCSTCGARLKVRDQRAIGELSLCPKCGSMVMITPPSPGGEVAQPPSGNPHGSSPQIVVGGGHIGSDFDDAASLLADTMDDVAPQQEVASASAISKATTSTTTAKPTSGEQVAAKTAEEAPTDTPHSRVPSGCRNPQSEPPPITPPTESMSSFDLDPNAAAVASPLAQVAATKPQPQAVMQSNAGSVAPPPVSQPAWATPSQMAWQRYGLIGAAVLAAVVLVSGMLFFLLRGPRDEPVVINDPPVEHVDPIPDPEDVRNHPPEVVPEEMDPPPVDEPPIEPDDPNIDEPEVPPVTEPENEPPAIDDPAIDDPPGDAPPLFGEGPDDPIDKPLEEPSADNGLGELAPLIDAFPLPPAPRARPDDEPSDVPAPVPTATASRARPDPVNVNVSQRMADTLAGIDTQGAPLTKVVELITQISTVPITLQPEALAQRKTPANAPISVALSETSVGDALKKILAQRGLAPVVRDDQIVVVSAASLGGLRTVGHAADDLADDEAAMKQLAAQVQALIAPESWEAVGGEGKIATDSTTMTVVNSFDVQFRVHVLLNKLRVARGQKPRGSFDPAMFAATARTQLAQAKLDQPVRAVFHVEQPLTKVLSHLEKAAGVNFLIDWQALLEAGWPPHSTAAVVADGVPLDKTLDELLSPMDLTYRAIDATTLQITSIQALTTEAELELYPIGAALAAKKIGPEKMIADLQAELGPGLFKAAGGSFVILYDAPSQSLLVRLPQAQQRALQSLLTK